MLKWRAGGREGNGSGERGRWEGNLVGLAEMPQGVKSENQRTCCLVRMAIGREVGRSKFSHKGCVTYRGWGSKKWEVGGGSESFCILIEDQNNFYSCKLPQKYSLLGMGKGIYFFAKLTKTPGWDPFGSFSNRKSGEEAIVSPPHDPATDRGSGAISSCPW